MSNYKSKEKNITYTSLGRLTGLTDVKLQLWDPDHTQVVTDGVLTEQGSTGEYYYSYTPQKTGTYYGSIDTVTKIHYREVNFVVVDKPRTVGGGRCFYDGPEFTDEEKAALLAMAGAPTKALKEIAKVEDILVKIREAIEHKVDEQLGIVKSEIISAVRTEIQQASQGDRKEIQIVGDEIMEKTNRINQTMVKSMDSLEERQDLTERLILEKSDAKTLAKVLEEAKKKKRK